ncbi:S-4TM family putative pore-forming effector [Variovorax sp. 770b2]|uniref:S-4TM family putative pore-forming effector n=1 Tax=Variovorax sp. 770b2 TaxID=1566271 RepID=UPI0008EB3891|nr:S-4TM family putative pore-forming effector [Variovorax sp. 770b2]SFQ34161.1 hypothetical protein SAMN03159339_6852 [Variovorax sp. 770b2]
MNQIITKQNERYSLQLLSAQRQTYSDAKCLLAFQLVLIGPLAAATAMVSIFVPDWKIIVALWGVIVLVLDLGYFTPKQKRLRESGARIQERFDCEVFNLSWDATRVGGQEPHENVIRQSARYQKIAHTMTPLEDWYSVVVGSLPLPMARLVCQRTNCWWDAEQRRKYASVVGGILLASFLIVLALGVFAKLSVNELILIVLFPMLSTLKQAYQQWSDNREAANRLDILRACAEKSWKAALNGADDRKLENESRALQGEIFDGRKRNPLVFDFLFKRLRDEHEAQMDSGAAHLVAEAEQAMKP